MQIESVSRVVEARGRRGLGCHNKSDDGRTTGSSWYYAFGHSKWNRKERRDNSCYDSYSKGTQ